MTAYQNLILENVIKSGYKLFDPGRSIPPDYYVGRDYEGEIEIVNVHGDPVTTITADNGLKFYLFPDYSYGYDGAPDAHVMYLAEDVYKIAFGNEE